MDDKNVKQRFEGIVDALSAPTSYLKVCHEHYEDEPMPSIAVLQDIVEKCRQLIFPGFYGFIPINPTTLKYYTGLLVDQIYEMLNDQVLAGLCFSCTQERTVELLMSRKKLSKQITIDFIESIPMLREKMSKDVEAAFLNDPAASHQGEVVFSYPSIKAICNYRVAHCLYKLGVPMIPRIISELAHSETGIDIHPHAQIGESFSIDHGTGVVIGSTCIIGDRVQLFQGVTLGAKSFPLDENGNPIKGIARHPIVENDVVIYSNATILGRITVGHHATIGGNVWVTDDVLPYARIIQGRSRVEKFIDGGGI
ncbi:serine acetyltransferase [Halosquirtibacter xylanolyticus]|uniref:serine O-acetyltransferase EpsC n=1 Tax=Halosquirtibacter xylanolyticus TaxID=3374599 RepID=UPI00374A1653|nr:serine acetyltransferase [Prolixibacteraceae bacterium]